MSPAAQSPRSRKKANEGLQQIELDLRSSTLDFLASHTGVFRSSTEGKSSGSEGDPVVRRLSYDAAEDSDGRLRSDYGAMSQTTILDSIADLNKSGLAKAATPEISGRPSAGQP